MRSVSAQKKLLQRMSEMQGRLQEAEDTLNAIRSGAIDALVVHTPRGEQLFTLKGADQSYRALVEAMNEGAVTLNGAVISFCNTHFVEMLRMPMEQVFGASIFDFVRAETFPAFLKRLQKGQATHGQLEAKLIAKSGLQVPVILSASRYLSEGNVSVGLVLTDITQRKDAERARQELSRSVLNAQEQERQRVARDLHDGVNQLLSSAKFRLTGQTVGADYDALRKNVDQARGLVEKAIGEVRVISRNLRPSELDDLGLVAALRSLTNEFQKRTGVTSQFKLASPLKPGLLQKEVEMALYRIAQEALNNVEKHSRGSRVEVCAAFNPTEALLIVRDNGRGFARRRLPSPGAGWGLDNMAERATLLGGSFHAASGPGRGAEISVRIPVCGAKELSGRKSR